MVTRCPHCQQKVRVQDEGLYRCPACSQTFRFSTTAPPPEEVTVHLNHRQNEVPLCERCGTHMSNAVCADCGFFVCEQCATKDAEGKAHCLAHAIETRPFGMLKGLLREPTKTFSAITPDSRNLNRAILFGVVLGILQVIVLNLYNFTMLPQINEIMKTLAGGMFGNFDLKFTSADLISGILFSPFSVLISLFFQVLVLHLCYRLVGSGKNGMTATIKLVFYAQAANIFSLIPFIGGLFIMIFQLVLLVVGGRILHNTTTGRAVAATLIPLFFLMIVGFILVLVVFGIKDALPLGTGGGTLI